MSAMDLQAIISGTQENRVEALRQILDCTLSQEDITHYQRIVVALQETIRLMQQIDAAIPGWPLE
jgi:uncharacterized membrane protein YccC